ncbi:MAG: GH3 auxin-responsive promoter family protein [Candidatus Omnitrophica bacterium]|nr:GH3 auxin-responsive promoter family protein [Candidatus Omnitrophota bacterium]
MRACKDPQETQENILINYLMQNQNTIFGKKHYFREISSYEQFVRNVPLRQHEDLSVYISQIAEGTQQVLTADPVVAFEETSGTNARVKRIPYTKSLLDEFDRAIGVWMCRISKNYPKALRGDLYLSISPPLKKPSLSPQCKIPIGTGDDLSYFNAEVFPYLSDAVISLRQDENMDSDAFYFRTIERLLCSQLSFISVWSPTFFLNLDKKLQAYFKRTGGQHDPFVWKDVFPSLSLLSCWADAQSAVWMEQVKERLGDIEIQGKGLLSTEGIVSIPFQKGKDPVLALCSHFFEFRDKEGVVYPAVDLKKGEIYEVILTTGAGLCRYVTGDMVQITDVYENIPCMKFIGRSGRQSDLVGEKLTEYHVNQAIAQARRMSSINGCVFLCPMAARQYTLFIESRLSPRMMKEFACVVEKQLRMNPYYDQACRLGQLESLDIKRLPNHFELKMIKFLCHKFNMKEGHLKLSSLYRLGELDELLKKTAWNSRNMSLDVSMTTTNRSCL